MGKVLKNLKASKVKVPAKLSYPSLILTKPSPPKRERSADGRFRTITIGPSSATMTLMFSPNVSSVLVSKGMTTSVASVVHLGDTPHLTVLGSVIGFLKGQWKSLRGNR